MIHRRESKVKIKYVIVIAFILSIISLSISIIVLVKLHSENELPSGIKEVELFDGVSNKVIIDSSSYYFTLQFFQSYAQSYSLKVENSSGASIRRIYLNEGTKFYDFWVILKEARLDSVIVWIEKEES